MFRPDHEVVERAAASLGWAGEPVPVRFCGEDAWAIASLTSAGAMAESAVGESRPATSAVEISGVIIAGTAGSTVAIRASVFAGYSPRAVLVPDGPEVLQVQVAAAMLGQGVVVASATGVRLLSAAEPTQPGVAGVAGRAQGLLVDRVYENLVTAGCS